MGFIVDVPGHRTDSMAADPPSEKERIIATLLNKSKVPLNIRGTTIKPGKKGAIADWQIMQGDTVVRQWLQAGALEVVDEKVMPPPTPEEPPPTNETDNPTSRRAQERATRTESY
jgi:hypothetical protein